MSPMTVADNVKIIAKSKVMLSVLNQLRHLQKTSNTNVLIRGETGTGKELIARAIHEGSHKKDGPFIPVNCGSIPEQLAESSLFGHVQGAFTGANTSRKGYFELADKGTLFFDEIGDMPTAQQVKLLRVLEEKKFRALGGQEEKSSDVRIISATNAYLENNIGEGLFRRDLFYRLATFTIFLPPLRERIEDIPLLANHFVQILSKEMGQPAPKILPDTLSSLLSRRFYGNIRELRNIVEHALILCNGKEISPENLPVPQKILPKATAVDSLADITMVNRSFGGHAPAFCNTSLPPDQMEFLLIRGALAHTENDIGEAAEMLNVNPLYIKMVYRKIRSVPSDNISDESKIIEYVCMNKSINNSECRDLLKTGIHRASYLLKKLCRQGRLDREKGGRWTRYVLPG